MKKDDKNNSFLTDHMLLIGIALAGIYWVLDSFMSIFLSYENSLLEQIFGINLDEIWMRIIVLCLFAIFGSHAQYTLNERKKAALKMEKAAAQRDRFQRLLSPDLAEMVVSGKLRVEKGGEDRFATVLFADIRGFTTISENIQASELLKLLNEYYENIVEIVFNYEGTVDKFIGDSIMVIWGAPISHSDDPCRAVKAALAIQMSMARFNAARTLAGDPLIEVGIGINTGKLVAGYIGSSRTMSYSVIGDAVNMSYRLCSAAKPNEILITENTAHHLPDNVQKKALAPIQVKGKFNPLKVYAVTGISNQTR
ncbi:MAG: adenylate/guanylate cyclase domain-containing protein [Desulfobacteraceae bacterium]|jgi:adenylate cyclase